MSDERININEADENTLVTLPGIAQALAARIVEYRENIHPFEDIEDLAAVPGISERMVRNFADLITVRATGSNGSARAAEGSSEAAAEPLAELVEDNWSADAPAAIDDDEIVSLDELQNTITVDEAEEIETVELAGDEAKPSPADEPLPADMVAEDMPYGEAQDESGTDAAGEDEILTEVEDELEAEISGDEEDLSHSVDVEAVLAEESDQGQEISYEMASQEVSAEVDTVEQVTVLPDAFANDDDPADHFEAAESIVEQVESDGFEMPSVAPVEIESDSETTVEPEVEPVRSPAPAPIPTPAPVATRRRLSWGTIAISALLGAGLTLLVLALLNGGLVFATRDNATALQQTINQQTATISDQIDTITAQSEQIRSQAALIEMLQTDLNALSGDVSEVERSTEDQISSVTSDLSSLDAAVSDLTTALSTNSSDISELQEIDIALQEVDNAINARIDNVAGTAEEVDSFLINLRDLLIGLKGIPEPAPDDGGDAPAAQPTRTPRPTPTPLAVPTQSP